MASLLSTRSLMVRTSATERSCKRRMSLQRVVVRSIPLKDIEEVDKKVEEAIKEAEETCKQGNAKQCAVAWDNVEELSAAAAHKKVAYKEDPASSDPLEAFCEDNPDADECRVYED